MFVSIREMLADDIPGFKHQEPTTTWLTFDEKGKLVQELEAARQSGQLDDDSFVPLRRLNTLSGVASVFSCTGHPEAPQNAGYIQLRVSRRVADILDGGVIAKLWEDGLVCAASKDWQLAYDTAGQPIPRISYIVRFPHGFMDRVCESICQYVNKEL